MNSRMQSNHIYSNQHHSAQYEQQQQQQQHHQQHQRQAYTQQIQQPPFINSNNNNSRYHNNSNNNTRKNSRNSSVTLSSMMDQQNPPPQTPFDMAYGASMLPRQLLMGSPFIQTTPQNSSSPQRSYFPPLVHSSSQSNFHPQGLTGLEHPPNPPYYINGGGNNLQQHQQQQYAMMNNNSSPEGPRRRGYNYMMSRPPSSMRSLSVSSSTTSFSDMYSSNNNIQDNQHNINNTAPTTRSICLKDLPKSITLTQILDNIKIGPIENCHFTQDQNSRFRSVVVSFVDHGLAKKFYQETTNNHKLAIALNAPDLKLSWFNSNPITPFVSNAINNDSATRNVYIGNLSANITKDSLEEELEHYGTIDSVDFIPEKKIAFVHFTSMASAIKAVEQLPLDSNWSRCKIFYGKDRCAQQPFNKHNSTATSNGGSGAGDRDDSGSVSSTRDGASEESRSVLKQHISDIGVTHNDLLNTTLSQKTQAASTLASSAGGHDNVGNRCVYLGGLHPLTTVEEICNVVRGGLLQSVRLIKDRNICFLTFIDPLAAAQFFATTNIDGMLVHGRRLKIGWGKHSGSLPNSIALAVTAGASRNLYIGVVNEEDQSAPRIPDDETLRKDFSSFGEIEQINFFKDGLCAFVNFLNISSAIKCVDEFQNNDFENKFDGRYNTFKISFGKDRCGNPPKAKKSKKSSSFNNNGNGNSNNNNLNGNGKNKRLSNIKESSKESPSLSDDKSKSSDALVFASMGITSKSLAQALEQEQKNEEEDPAEVKKDEQKDSKNNLDDDEERDTKQEDGAAKEDEEEQAPQHGSDDEHEPEPEHEEDNDLLLSPNDSLSLEYSTSDSDSVSIVIGNNDTDLSLLGSSKPTTTDERDNNLGGSTVAATITKASNKNHSSHHHHKKAPPFQKKNSATQFRLSNNSRSSSVSYDNNNFPPVYYNSSSRQSSKSQLNKYYQQAPQQHQLQQQQQLLPPHAAMGHGARQSSSTSLPGYFATSGSAVMAQYLAQSQHDNLLYATHVLTQDHNNNAGNMYHHGSGRHGGGGRSAEDIDDVTSDRRNERGRDVIDEAEGDDEDEHGAGNDDRDVDVVKRAEEEDDDDDVDDDDDEAYGDPHQYHPHPVQHQMYYPEYAQMAPAAAGTPGGYIYPIQQYPYILAPPSMGHAMGGQPPPGSPQFIQYSMPTTPILDGISNMSQSGTPTKSKFNNNNRNNSNYYNKNKRRS